MIRNLFPRAVSRLSRGWLAAFGVMAWWMAALPLPGALPPPVNPQPANLATNVAATPSLAWSLGDVELVPNGGFESGTLAGWTIEGGGFGGQPLATNGNVNPPGPETNVPLLAGNYFAQLQPPNFGGFTFAHTIYQDFAIPTNASPLILRWFDRVRNYEANGEFVITGGAPHAYVVQLLRASDNAGLALLYLTEPGSPPLNEWTKRQFDLSPFRGLTVRLVFQVITSLGTLYASIDGVSVATQFPGVSNEVYFATTQNFGPSNLLGVTTSTSWPLPELEPNSTYYWRIATRSGAASAAGPTWRFTTAPIGPLDHFAWDPIYPTQSVNVSFPVRVTAKDARNFTVTNFTGAVDLSASRLLPGAKAHLLADEAYTAVATYVGSTLGYSFTPSSDLWVEALRCFGGERVSLWTDDGVVLARETVAAPFGQWTEQPLSSGAILLQAGRTYRLGVYSGATQTHATRFDASTTFAHGTIHQSYEGFGDAFPTQLHPAQWWFVDLTYQAASYQPLLPAPAQSGGFVRGVWSSALAVSGDLGLATVRAQAPSGASGHSGLFQLVAFSDTDQDGMPDTWEDSYDLDPSDPADADLDSDGDGTTNRREYEAGTNPRNTDSVFRIQSARRQGNDLVLVLQAVAGKRYRLERRQSLTAGEWAEIANSIPGQDGVVEVIDSGAANTGPYFYRFSLQP